MVVKTGDNGNLAQREHETSRNKAWQGARSMGNQNGDNDGYAHRKHATSRNKAWQVARSMGNQNGDNDGYAPVGGRGDRKKKN